MRPRVKVRQRRSADGRHAYQEVELLDTLADKAGGDCIAAEAMARAEAAAAALAERFPEMVRPDLMALREAVAAFLGRPAPAAAELVRRLAHDLKGQGGSFGYPTVSAVAASLTRLIRCAPTLDARLAEAARAHADALELAVERRQAGPPDAEFQHLLTRLERMTDTLVIDDAAEQPPPRSIPSPLAGEGQGGGSTEPLA